MKNRAWGVHVNYESGFTEGTVGFGVDGHTYTTVVLDTGKGRNGLGHFGLNGDGDAETTQTEAGAAVKVRLSNTVLKSGQMTVASPVFSTDDARLTPEIGTGTYIESSEIEGLTLNAGHFNALSSRSATGRDSAWGYDENGDDKQGLSTIDFVGGSYAVTDDLSVTTAFSQVEDYFRKQYYNVNYTLAVDDVQSFNFDVNMYKSDDEGKKLYGEVDNKIWSLAAAYTYGAHTITLAQQRSTGDTGYAYGIDGNSTIYLANSIQWSDFNGKDERSNQVRYDLDMSTLGVPGLSFMTRYVIGDEVDWGGDTRGQETEWNLESKYVLQEGPAKDLSFRLRYAAYRANGIQNENYLDDVNDLRLIAEYPLNIF